MQCCRGFVDELCSRCKHANMLLAPRQTQRGNLFLTHAHPLSARFVTAAQVTLSQSNPNCIGYANNLEITYRGQTLKWQFKAAA